MKKSFLALAALLLVFTACEKDKPAVDAVSNENSFADMAEFHEQNRVNMTQTFIVDANSPISITGEKGATLTIPANNFLDGYGNVVEGNIEISLIEITTKSEMLMANKPTVTAEGEALISGGEYFIDVTLPGSDVTLRQVDLMELDVPAENPTDEMKLWRDDGDGWVLAGADERAPDGILEPYDMGYIASIEAGWINLDLIMSFPGAPVPLDIIVPAGSDPATTSVFISVDMQATMLIVEDMYFNGWDQYNCPEVPENLAVHVGVIQMDPFTGDNTYLITPYTIPFGGGTINMSGLLPGSIGGMDADIAALP
jgi:hypothetical protein